MGSSSGGGGGGGVGGSNSKKKYSTFRSRQRANMSFFIVVMFFALFGIIVFTEFFLIDENGHGAGVLVRHGSLTYRHRQNNEQNDYEDAFQNDDYISIRMNGGGGGGDGGGSVDINNINDAFGALLLGGHHQQHIQPAIPVIIDDDNNNYQSSNNKLLIESQLPIYPNYLLPANNGNWQNVNGTRYKFYVFSAFYDNRKGQRSIRVIGATKTRGPERVWCRLWYDNNNNNNVNNNNTNNLIKSKTVQGKIKVIRENWNLKYSACFIMCPLLYNQSIPQMVSIVSKIKLPPGNLLKVINNFNESNNLINNNNNNKKKFAACIKPLHFNYNSPFQLLEFIELNRIMGIEHFIFYNHTIGDLVNCILHDYITKGIITILPWHLNMISQKEIRTEGLFAALNDCLYRSMYRFTHILLIDLDEFIIPRYSDTLPELIDSINNRMNTKSTTGSYSFQNAFFYLQWDDDKEILKNNENNGIIKNLITMKKTRRRSKLHPHKQRSKYICKPELIIEAGNHFIWEFLPGYGTLNIPSDLAILHHYRICEFGGNDCIKTTSLIDNTTLKYKSKLIDIIKERYYYFQFKCDLNINNNSNSNNNKVFHKIMNGDNEKNSQNL